MLCLLISFFLKAFFLNSFFVSLISEFKGSIWSVLLLFFNVGRMRQTCGGTAACSCSGCSGKLHMGTFFWMVFHRGWILQLFPNSGIQEIKQTKKHTFLYSLSSLKLLLLYYFFFYVSFLFRICFRQIESWIYQPF